MLLGRYELAWSFASIRAAPAGIVVRDRAAAVALSARSWASNDPASLIRTCLSVAVDLHAVAMEDARLRTC